MALLALPASRSSGRAVDYARGRSHGFDTLRAHPLCESISSGQIMLAINHPPAAQLLTGGNLFEDEAKGLRRRRVSTRNTLRCKRLCVSVETHTHTHRNTSLCSRIYSTPSPCDQCDVSELRGSIGLSLIPLSLTEAIPNLNHPLHGTLLLCLLLV